MSDAFVPEELARLFPDGGRRLMPYFDVPGPGVGADPRIWAQGSREKGRSLEEYRKQANNPKVYPHDEPWVTMISLYGLFGDQSNLAEPTRFKALNNLLEPVFPASPPVFARITGAHVEVCLPENKLYQKYLREKVFDNGSQAYHLFSDCQEKIALKCETKGSLEGSTNLDALISGVSAEGRHIHVFIEAKFHSDISYSVMYVPVRNQIARNIDCAMDLMTRVPGARNPEKRDLSGLGDAWFALLTPGIFRTQAYGGPVVSPLSPLQPIRSRLYCYKMDEYREKAGLRADLPHWEGFLSESDWSGVVSRIGWLTFEDIGKTIECASWMTDADRDEIRRFMKSRRLERNP